MIEDLFPPTEPTAVDVTRPNARHAEAAGARVEPPRLSASGPTAPSAAAPPRSGLSPAGLPSSRAAPAAQPARSAAPAADRIDNFLFGASGQPAAQPAQARQPGDAVLAIREPKIEHETLVVAAEPIFVLVTQLRTARADADLRALRQKVSQELRRFEDAANRFGARAEEVTAARYVLCALTDETVLTTPWGSRSSWSANSLLSELHGETWGGEKVFQILDRIIASPAQHVALLRLVDMALMLGFEGRYRVIDNGRYQLEDRRNDIGRVLKSILPQPPDELSGQWQGVASTDRLRRYVPFWIVAVSAAAALAILYTVLQFSLVQAVDPIDQRLQAIGKVSS
ncbi:MAG: type IVB secretion system protein IcmH/DotU [Ancalomicrobiaceae bacterium]|nr:type IVB secretion system protein IcmH/DotU [Ancalomicrobiaceae bacterium]